MDDAALQGLVEGLVAAVFRELLGVQLDSPFRRMSYAEVHLAARAADPAPQRPEGPGRARLMQP
jgi:hypothetical protein